MWGVGKMIAVGLSVTAASVSVIVHLSSQDSCRLTETQGASVGANCGCDGKHSASNENGGRLGWVKKLPGVRGRHEKARSSCQRFCYQKAVDNAWTLPGLGIKVMTAPTAGGIESRGMKFEVFFTQLDFIFLGEMAAMVSALITLRRLRRDSESLQLQNTKLSQDVNELREAIRIQQEEADTQGSEEPETSRTSGDNVCSSNTIAGYEPSARPSQPAQVGPFEGYRGLLLHMDHTGDDG